MLYKILYRFSKENKVKPVLAFNQKVMNLFLILDKI